MLFFGKLRVAKATTLILLFALVLGIITVSVASEEEVRAT
jgi:hypothetical protein